MRSAQILTGTYRIFLHSLHVTYAYGYTYYQLPPIAGCKSCFSIPAPECSLRPVLPGGALSR